MNITEIPQNLKDLERWVCFRFAPGKDGRKDKIPYDPKTGYKAKSNTSETWTTFQNSLECSEQYDGIGIMFGDGLCGCDIDHCIDEAGNLSELAMDIIGTMDSYTEISPSGTGVHILFFAEAVNNGGYYKKNPNNGIEVYNSGRFFTVTGNRIYGEKAEKRDAQFADLRERYMRMGAYTPECDTEQDEAWAADRFEKLMSGNYSGYNSQSEADFTLCLMLAQKANGDEEKIDAMFRESGLMREKWDREQSGSTYGAITVKKAVNLYKSKLADCQPRWETPIPFSEFTLPEYPVIALPEVVAKYVAAVAETTQTSPDMAATAALAVLSLCVQGKYRIQAKADWTEPLNLFTVIVASPAERKSAVISLMTQALNEFEATKNKEMKAEIIENQMQRSVLEKRQRHIEEQVSRGKADKSELQTVADEIARFQDKKPLRLYVDDVTTEKLTSVLVECGGRAAIISAEGGIFDVLSGLYTKTVNIDVLLKGHAGDSIRVDRIGRGSESVMNPALAILLTVQPSVLSGLIQNGTFRGRGLTARFLYSIPASTVGGRRYRTEPIPQETAAAFRELIHSLLSYEPFDGFEMITISPEAAAMLEAFSTELERLTEYGYIAPKQQAPYMGAGRPAAEVYLINPSVLSF